VINDAPIDRPKTAGNWLVSRLRDSIISGELAANAPIRQELIALAYGVSRMPVRQAIDILAAEGWVEHKPHKGAVVAAIDPDDALELFELRHALERLAIKRSFPNLSDRQLEAVKVALSNLEAGSGDIPVLHQSFHLTLYAAAGPRLLRVLMQQLDAVQRYLRFEKAALHVSDQDRDEHRALAEAACSRDVGAGVAILKEHIAVGGIGIANSLRARNESMLRANQPLRRGPTSTET
jgi:DNA-binding GntR family transcriptional regulator